MKILIACEESQSVTIEFRKLGFEAYSCDILPCSGGHPEWHIQGDVTKQLSLYWDVVIAFPPCTRLTVTANKWYKTEFSDRFPNIHQERKEAIEFFNLFVNANAKHIAIENPVGVMSTEYRKPNQIIQPWQFGDKATKKTCLWLTNLPNLIHTEIVEPEVVIYNSKSNKSGKSKYPVLWSKKATATERSKTFPGIAKAMAEQWGNFLLNPPTPTTLF